MCELAQSNRKRDLRARIPIRGFGIVRSICAPLCIVLAGPVLLKADDNNVKKRDNPAGAVRYERLLQLSSADRPPSPDAMKNAIERVQKLRKGVATRANIDHRVMAAFAGRGIQTQTIAGIPVGPLPVVVDPRVPLKRTDLNELGVPRLIELGFDEKRGTHPPLQVAPLRVNVNPRGWVWLGPGNIGGRIRSLLIHPRQPNVMWAGSVGGGVWKTLDGGASWSPLYDFMANMAVSCLVMDPNDPDCIYAGTGEGFYNSDAIQGFGVFYSLDGGLSWAQLPGTTSIDYRYVNRMAVAEGGTASPYCDQSWAVSK